VTRSNSGSSSRLQAILEDDTLAPTQNDWCAYCPLLMECSVTHRSTDFWLRKLAAVAPERKVGRKIMVQLSDSPYDMGEYVELLPKAKMAQNVLKRYIEAVQDALKADASRPAAAVRLLRLRALAQRLHARAPCARSSRWSGRTCSSTS
jgi:hypothetical protein